MAGKLDKSLLGYLLKAVPYIREFSPVVIRSIAERYDMPPESVALLIQIAAKTAGYGET